jgi:hypothetical protein
MKQFKQTTKSPVGTSFHDTVIKTTVNKLVKALGKPMNDQNDGKDKINFEWVLELNNGDVFTVYDYKEYRILDLDEIIEFHIGGINIQVTEQALWVISHELEQVKDDWDNVIDDHKKTDLSHYYRFEEWEEEHQGFINFLKKYYDVPTRKKEVEKPRIVGHEVSSINVFTVEYEGVYYIVRHNELYDDTDIFEWDILDDDGTLPSKETINKLIDICTPVVVNLN